MVCGVTAAYLQLFEQVTCSATPHAGLSNASAIAGPFKMDKNRVGAAPWTVSMRTRCNMSS